MEKLTFQVEGFDAPLDLILTLLSKNKLNILDIDISSLLDQYLKYIENWKEQNFDIASEFLELVSHLVYIKTLSLLPKYEEEHQKLKQELTGRLIEYKLCKLAAGQLALCDLSGKIFTRPPTEFDIDKSYSLTHPPGVLYSALADVMGKEARRAPPPRKAFEPLIETPIISVTVKILWILRQLRLDGSLGWDKLFIAKTGKSGMVATFLAVLELVKGGKIYIKDDKISLAERTKR